MSEEWERLDAWVAETYEVEGDNIEMARKSVWEAGDSYTRSQATDWLFATVDKSLATMGSVPTDVLAAIRNVSQESGIPEWFLVALVFKESSFDPLAENSSGAFGLFQLMPREQRWTTDILIEQGKIPKSLLDRYPERSDDFYRAAMSDPLINARAGVLVLQSKGLSNIDWGGSWKEQTYNVLAAYGGYSKNHSRAKSYVEGIQKMADSFQKERVWPVIGKITAPFGKRDKKLWPDGHRGIDIKVGEGTPVLSAAGCVVIFTGCNGAYGNCVIASNGVYEFLYAHLSEIKVKAGDTVAAGETIGLSGNTGKSTGPHLHFEVKEGGKLINPLNWLGMKGGG